jgi:hypothetical protein
MKRGKNKVREKNGNKNKWPSIMDGAIVSIDFRTDVFMTLQSSASGLLIFSQGQARG